MRLSCLTIIAAAALGVAGPGSSAVAQEAAASSPFLQALQWRLVGPFRGGRVTAVAGHPDEPNVYYMGAAGGGVWKTGDAGQTWQNVSDGFFQVGTIAAIAVAPSNRDIVYVGTGEGPIRGNATARGDGVYRSDNAGKTWRRVGLEQSRHISKIIVDPTNPELVYAAVQGDDWGPSEQRGIYRSRDGGKTWEKVLFVSPSTGASDLAMDSHNSNILYAGMWDHERRPWTIRSGGPGSGLWKSVDGGTHWTKLTRGLPSLIGKTGVTVSPADPNRVWAMIEAVDGGLYRSDDAGRTWKWVNRDPGVRDRGWYYTHIFAHPTDPNSVYVLAAPMVVSHDGGVTFDQVRTPHGDNHGLWINPKNPNLMIESNDGGANVSLNAGKTWSTQMNQPTGQFYRVETDQVWPYRIYSAQQDETTVRIADRTLEGGIGQADWRSVGGGESGFLSFDRAHPRYVYATALLGSATEYDDQTGLIRQIDPYPVFAGFRQDKDLKYRFNWNAPILVSQHDPSVIYHAGNKILKSTDRGVSWTEISPDLTRARPETMGTTGGPIMIEGAGGEHYATLTYIAESPHDGNVLWAGSDDGLVHVTRDGGAHWADVTPAGLPEGQVNAIEVSPHAPGTAYIAVVRYKLDDFRPYAFKTTDYGRTWSPITNGLPADKFVQVVREDPVRTGLLYAGTESGVFVSFDGGGSWQPFQLNLPVVPVNDLEVHGDDLVAATQGRALWVLDGIDPVRLMSPHIAAAPIYLFPPAPALRVEGGGRPEPNVGSNPPEGALIYYSFARAPSGPVTLEILDSAGSVLRRFSSETTVQEKDQLVKGAEGEPAGPPLPKQAGLNRYVWNLRPAPMVATADTIRFVPNRPYRVGPGTYTARLTADGTSVEQQFKVLPQPNLAPVPQAQWDEQQALSRRLYDLVNDVHRETNAMRSIHAQLDAMRKGAQLAAALAQWEEQVPQAPLPNGVQDLIGFPSRLLSTQILHTLSILDGPPPVPVAVRQHVAELEAQWAVMKEQAERLRTRAKAEFNITAATNS
jgi:photosystem II stability/assembly factor-like uncharacterized protein